MSAAAKAREPGPLEQLEQLERELAGGTALARGYLVRGDERHFRDQALRMVSEAAARAGLELARHDALDPDFALRDVCGDLGSASMFAPARCVLVRNAARLVRRESSESGGRPGGETEFAAAALAFLRRKNEPGVLVCEADGLRADHALVKALREAGGKLLSLRRLYDSPPPWDRHADPRRTELVQWLMARAAERGIPLKSEDAVFVAAATGNDLGALLGQLERIQHRGAQSLRSVVPWSSGGSPWEVAEHLVRGDLAHALLGIEALYKGGFHERDGGRETNAGALTAMLLGSLRNKLSSTLAALEDPAAAGQVGNPRERAELEARLPLRTAPEWHALARELSALERRSRQTAGIDLDDLARFALGTRSRARAQGARR